jgi:hypothetical protein
MIGIISNTTWLLEARQLLCLTICRVWLVDIYPHSGNRGIYMCCAAHSFLSSVTYIGGQCLGRRLSWTTLDCIVLVERWCVSCRPSPSVEGSIWQGNTLLQHHVPRGGARSTAEMGVSRNELTQVTGNSPYTIKVQHVSKMVVENWHVTVDELQHATVCVMQHFMQ